MYDYEDVLKEYGELTPFSEMEEIEIKARKNNSKKSVDKNKKRVYNSKCKKEIEIEF